MNSRWLMIKQLDKQLKEWRLVSNKYDRPRAGWVKTIREALNISTAQLADRLELSRSRISQLENAEKNNAVTLHTLQNAANAMGCELVYAIVPKDQSTLEEIIKSKVEEIVKERVARVAHSMSLENQTLKNSMLEKQEKDLFKNIMEHLDKKIWVSFKNHNKKK